MAPDGSDQHGGIERKHDFRIAQISDLLGDGSLQDAIGDAPGEQLFDGIGEIDTILKFCQQSLQRMLQQNGHPWIALRCRWMALPGSGPVPYSHLTLPTNREGCVRVAAGSYINK